MRLPDGTLLVEGVAVRPGIYEYRTTGGRTIRELVPRSTILDSAAGLARAPVTLHHPDEDVRPENWDRYAVGDTDGETVIVEDTGFQRVKVAVRRKDAIQAVDSGSVVELSPGYDALVDPTPGEDPEFGAYDAVQRARRYNHLALVDLARGGHECRLRVDGAAVMVAPLGTAPAKPPGPAKGTNSAGEARTDVQEARVNPRIATLLGLLGIAARVDTDDAALDQALEAVRSLQKARQDAEKKAEDEESELKELQDELEELKGAKDELEKMTAERDKLRDELKELQDEIGKMREEEQKKADAAERAELLKLASQLRVDRADSLDLAGLRKAVAAAFMGGAMRKDASDAYISAALDMARDRLRPDPDGRAAGSAAWRADQAEEEGEENKDEREDGLDPWSKQMDAAFRAGRGER